MLGVLWPCFARTFEMLGELQLLQSFVVVLCHQSWTSATLRVWSRRRSSTSAVQLSTAAPGVEHQPGTWPLAAPSSRPHVGATLIRQEHYSLNLSRGI